MKQYLYITITAFLLMSITVFAKSPFDLEDGTYQVTVGLEGGSGRATIEENTTMTVIEECTSVIITWSSPNYDYMIVDGETYYPINTEGNSVFEIPVLKFNEGYKVIGDTVAMSTPHEIEYTLTVNYSKADKRKQIASGVALFILAGIVGLQFKKANRNFIQGNKSEE